MRLICTPDESKHLVDIMNKFSKHREKYLKVYNLELTNSPVSRRLNTSSPLKIEKVSCIKVGGTSEIGYKDYSTGTRYVYEHDEELYEELLNWYKFRNRDNKLDNLGI